MKKLLSFFLFAFSFFSAQGQTERAVVSLSTNEFTQTEIELNNGDAIYRSSATIEVPLIHVEPFLAFSIIWESETSVSEPQFHVTFSDEKKQKDILSIKPDSHAEPKGLSRISQLYFTKKEMTELSLFWQAESKLKNVEVHFFSPGKSEAKPVPVQPISSRMACPCPQPDYLDRDGWCPAGNCPPDATPVPTNVTHLIVHHSAGSNSSSDWAATVRAIWDFHVNVNGWDDIGYNWLVDPNGVLYEGRGDNRLGAHFCGQNGGTMGVCVMGDFTDITPTPDAYARLEDLLSWKICDIGADPLTSSLHASSGLDLMHISGHRDGCSTACPGDSFYPTFDDIRTEVQNQIQNECNDIVIASPTELEAEAIDFTSIELTWIDNAENETGYTIERSVSFNTNFEEIGTAPANSTGYSDNDVQPSTGYFYRVKADTSDFSSLYSNEAFAATAFSAVDDEKLDGGSVRVSPNPASNEITLVIENQWVGNIAASLFDALGRQVLDYNYIEKASPEIRFNFDVSQLPAGVFWVKIEQGNGVSLMKKIVKN